MEEEKMMEEEKKNKMMMKEEGSKLVLQESFFEEDVKKLTKFQNKNKTFGIFGFPPFFDCRGEKEKLLDKGKSNYNSPPRTRGRR